MTDPQKIMKWANSLCPPARLYFLLSMILLALSVIQNVLGVGTTRKVGKGKNRICLGMYDCHSSVHPVVMFILQFIYIFAFSWILNEICKAGYTNVSWFILFLPFITFFAMLALFVFAVGLNKV
jgi:ABC-type multidrug transport system fused ATPase/permease subunit